MAGTEATDGLNRSFIDPIFLQQFPLCKENALEYFSRSPFYDSTSNNETIRMQGADISHLKGMTGIEFDLDDRTVKSENANRLFLIKKQRRFSPTSTNVIGVFYILDGTIYQCPNLLHLMMTKYNKISQNLIDALEIATDAVSYSHAEHNAASTGVRVVFPSNEHEQVNIPPESVGRKRQRLTDCLDFPSFNSCIGDLKKYANQVTKAQS